MSAVGSSCGWMRWPAQVGLTTGLAFQESDRERQRRGFYWLLVPMERRGRKNLLNQRPLPHTHTHTTVNGAPVFPCPIFLPCPGLTLEIERRLAECKFNFRPATRSLFILFDGILSLFPFSLLSLSLVFLFFSYSNLNFFLFCFCFFHRSSTRASTHIQEL